MDNNEAQKKEDLLLDLYKIHAHIPNDAQGNPLTPFGNFCAGYEAAQQQSAGEIAELKNKVSKLDGMLGKRNLHKEHEYLQRMNELKADNERLRKALQFYADGRHYEYCDKQSSERFGLDWIVEYGDIASEALSATTSQSLQAHDNEVLSKLRVINWTESMSVAWHKAIPDLHKAFDDLIELLKGK